MLPFRDLLKPKTPFYWDEHLDELFNESKLNIVKEIEDGVRIFDKSKPTCLATDWSKTGLGFWLFQKHCQCRDVKPFCCATGWKITFVGSRFTHPAESRYAPIEGEALAVADALDKARHFVLGCDDLIIAVDHKPLLKLFGDRSLADIPNNRLRNLKEKTLRYRFRMYHIPGKSNCAPDSVSRHPTGNDTPAKMNLPDNVATATNSETDNSAQTSTINIHPSPCELRHTFLAGIRHTDTAAATIDEGTKLFLISAMQPLKSITWDRVRIASNSNADMRKLAEIIESGMPANRQDLPEPLQQYHQYREHLSTIEGVLIYKDRIIVPLALREDVLTALHAAHQGVTSMTARADSSVFWHGIHPDITRLRNKCNHCNRMAPSQPNAPPTPPVLPEYPFQYLCSDFFHYKGRHYLVSVDRYSNWPIVEETTGGAQPLINSLRRTFVTYTVYPMNFPLTVARNSPALPLGPS